MHFKIVTSVLLFVTSQAVSAGPMVTRDEDYPEVIPGPGLPSLESLGLTTKQLYEERPPELVARSADFTPECGPSNAAYTNVNGVIACYNYLRNLGRQNCVAGSDVPSQFCRSGNAQALGQAVGANSASSYCSDVSLGLLWVINSCTRSDKSVAGFQAANGNGNLIVGGVNIDW